jgi:hypothetical protein
MVGRRSSQVSEKKWVEETRQTFDGVPGAEPTDELTGNARMDAPWMPEGFKQNPRNPLEPPRYDPPTQDGFNQAFDQVSLRLSLCLASLRNPLLVLLAHACAPVKWAD